MKRILIPAGGAILATGMLAAGLVGSAQAATDISRDTLTGSTSAAQSVVDFWTQSNNAALKSATEVNHWNDGKDVAKLKSKGGYTPDGKAGLVSPTGEEKKTAAKVKNINLPKTIGKVFFENSKGDLKWCSATSIQAAKKNLVATAGHCVYDTAAQKDTLDKWVFVPGYYQGKAPWGVYVGKTAYTHYDFSVYEDYDRDYAFVTVYNGVQASSTSKKVAKAEWDKFDGAKETSKKEITEAAYKAGFNDPNNNYTVEGGSATEKVDAGYAGAVVTKEEVRQDVYEGAKPGVKANGAQYGAPETVSVTEAEHAAYRKGQDGEKKEDFLGTVSTESGVFTITRYYVQKWIKPGTPAKFYANTYFITPGAISDVGSLGDNVGGQGFAWNQKTGQKVFTFGYPSAAHPDGHKAYTGVTPKWCYGTTTAKTVGSAAKKIEEHIALKCAMTEGANGAPWLIKYSNAKRLGYVNGVTSTFNDQDGNDRVDYISSPYFDGETNTVYRAAANSWSGSIVK